MKNKLLFILIIMFATSAMAQDYPEVRDVVSKKSIGKYNLNVTYNYTFALDTISKRRVNDIQILEIGDSFSRYYSSYADRADSVMYKTRMAVKKGGVNPFGYLTSEQRAICEDYYINYPSKGLLTCRTAIVNTEYEYVEEVSSLKWNFLNESENILGYVCKTATTKFRGREYRVFFTEQIPIRYGPWKFSGLPGLILKVEELSGLFKWEAIGITQSTGNIYMFDPQVGKTSIQIPYMIIKKINRKQLQNLQKKIWDDPIGLSVMHGKRMAEYSLDLKTKQKIPFTQTDWVKFRLPYIPTLELE